MKIDIIKTIIAVLFSGLITYGIYEYSAADETRWLLTIVSGLLLTGLSIFSIGIRITEWRSATMFSIVSAIFWCVFFGVNTLFAFFNFNISFFCIVNGIILLTYLLIFNWMYKNKQ
ncbi:MAG: hypothetical protein IJZ22_03625 [Bacteroidaceae bacterium]|nr:hypothetical protein [Bacteroidaceae bacterium]